MWRAFNAFMGTVGTGLVVWHLVALVGSDNCLWVSDACVWLHGLGAMAGAWIAYTAWREWHE